MRHKLLLLVLACILLASFAPVAAQDPEEGAAFLFGDPRPDAPELALRGEFAVGVTTLDLLNPDQVDIVNGPNTRYDRPLKVEVWYPAEGETGLTEYKDFLGRADQNNLQPFTFQGRATRNAAGANAGAPYPLLIISHGFPGSRYQLSYLGENLASKGYVVAAIHHTDSVFEDVGAAGVASALLNRSRDILFVIDDMVRLNNENDLLKGLIDAENVGLIGYSFGGLGAMNAMGVGLSTLAGTLVPGGVLGEQQVSNPNLIGDPRIKAAVLFAPFGGDLAFAGAPGLSFWNDDALQAINVPTFWVVGSNDDVSIYEAVVRLFEASTNSERYLLTYDNAYHNVAPNPPPADVRDLADYERYADPVWDESKLNNLNQHFVTAFFGRYLKGEASFAAYLDVPVADADEAVFSEDSAKNTYWAGFRPRTLAGMSLIRGE
jgi:predicted dienelactone hydrolase